MLVTVDDKSRISPYGAWKLWMLQWSKAIVCGVHTLTDMAYLRDRDERNYALMRENLLCDMNDGWTLPL